LIISIINHTNGKVSDDEVQRVIRAINRQIKGDFEPHWSMGATLRLEGRSFTDPTPEDPIDMRGDAVIYLWDKIDASGALGYHNLNHRGIPFGVVFTELTEDLDGQLYNDEVISNAWSVTLSHEALEMIADPEVNLLVMGSHPTNPDNYVFHWYEVCDAVQSEWYRIDHVLVSNFLLPLYFTSGEETGGRNDFLGTVNNSQTIRSFGVNPGGYIGFYNPESGHHENHFMHGDKLAEEWMSRKSQAGLTRRANRYQRGCNDQERCAFEGFVVKLTGTEKEYENTDAISVFKDKAEKILKDFISLGWEVNQDEYDFDEFEVLPVVSIDDKPSVIWDMSYKLQEHKDVDWVETMFRTNLEKEVSKELEEDEESVISLIPDTARARRSSHASTAAPDYDWHLEMVKAKEAWEKTKGEGIRIGHPDTGLKEHRELFEDEPGQTSNRLRLDLAKDYIGKDDNPVSKGEIANHGLSTGSVITSYDNDFPAERVHGIAPRAELVPLRVTNFQLMGGKGLRRVKKAIKHAREVGCNVISISLGSIHHSKSLQNEAARAVDDGIILLGAAGNGLKWIQPPVVYPARFIEFIAVAACNKNRKPWKKSSRGRSVEVTAPGQSVWRARVIDGEDRVRPGSGTSYAVAIAAGVAALWLSFHGVENLKEKYKRVRDGQIVYDRLVYAFRKIIHDHSDTNPDLKPDRFGGGIINAEKVLAAPLPEVGEIEGYRTVLERNHRLPGEDNTPILPGLPFPRAMAATAQKKETLGLGGFNSIFGGQINKDTLIKNKDMKEVLSELLYVKEKALSKTLEVVGDELSFQFMLDEQLYELFASAARNKKVRKQNIDKIRKALKKKELSKNLREKLA